MNNAVKIDVKDNVAVAIEVITKGSEISCMFNGAIEKITAQTDIPIYHKMAVSAIKKGEPVVKYGEHIGLAAQDIIAGSHVHTQNVEDHRENLDR